jgi:hypothetical protein
VGHDAMRLDSMEPDGKINVSELDSMESDTGSKVLCQNLLVWALLSWLLLSEP